MFEQDEFWMRKAIEAAIERGNLAEVPIGACLIDKNGELLAVAGNRTITCSDPTAHAEILVLRKAGDENRQLSVDGNDALYDDRTLRDVRWRTRQCAN